jgi:hypothetical protein
MKFLIEVLSEYPPPEALPLNGPVEGKAMLVLSDDGQSMTPCAICAPQFETVPAMALLKITRQD